MLMPRREIPRRKGSRCPGILSCSQECLHRADVEAYWYTRQAALDTLEAVTGMHRGDVEEYTEEHPLPTFKRWLLKLTYLPRDMAAYGGRDRIYRGRCRPP